MQKSEHEVTKIAFLVKNDKKIDIKYLVPLTLTALWADSADDKTDDIFSYFP